MAPSGKGLPLSGMPSPKAAIISGFPRIMAIMPPFRLIAMTDQSSCPLNSEKASPPGTSRVYLSEAEIATPAARTVSDTETPSLINVLFLIVALSPHPNSADNIQSKKLKANNSVADFDLNQRRKRPDLVKHSSGRTISRGKGKDDE